MYVGWVAALSRRLRPTHYMIASFLTSMELMLNVSMYYQVIVSPVEIVEFRVGFKFISRAVQHLSS